MIDLSCSTDPRVAAPATVLAEVDAVVRRHGVRLMVVGATARDLLAVAHVGTPPDRATKDVDIAVAVPSWDAFAAIAAEFEPVGRSRHKVRVLGVEVDIVPFGALETPDRLIDWGDGTVMNVVGLREAYDAAEAARLPGGLETLVPTIPGLAVLKLVAWTDRRLETRRDAVDLAEIIGWYASGRLLDELYDTAVALLERYDFDPDLAGAHRLGRHMGEMLGIAAASVLARFDDHGAGRLAADMPQTVADRSASLNALRQGLAAPSEA